MQCSQVVVFSVVSVCDRCFSVSAVTPEPLQISSPYVHTWFQRDVNFENEIGEETSLMYSWIYLSNFNKGSAVRGKKGRRLRPKGGGVLRELCKFPQQKIRGRALENFEFSAFWDLKMAPRLCKMMVFVQVFLAHIGSKRGQGGLVNPLEDFRKYDWGVGYSPLKKPSSPPQI